MAFARAPEFGSAAIGLEMRHLWLRYSANCMRHLLTIRSIARFGARKRIDLAAEANDLINHAVHAVDAGEVFVPACRTASWR